MTRLLPWEPIGPAPAKFLTLEVELFQSIANAASLAMAYVEWQIPHTEKLKTFTLPEQERVERIVRRDATQHNVQVQLDLSPGISPVNGDTVQLQQVMLNLMLNAFSAMSGAELNCARQLIIRTKSIEGLHVQVEVQDSGTGISPDKLEGIFEAFMTSKPQGLGMGLSICRTIIERHGGKIWAANNPDRGATFSIVLPVTRE
jgi:signal transduction histidine kinase